MIIITDIDDTIYSEKKGLSDVTIDAFNSFLEDDNNYLFFATGRPTFGVTSILKNTNLKNTNRIFIISFNGSFVADWDLNVIFNTQVEDQDILDIYFESQELDLVTYDKENIFSIKNSKEAQLESSLTNMPIIQTDKIISSNKAMLVGNPQIISKKIKILENKFPDLSLTISKPVFLEVNPKNINKGEMAQKLIDHLNIKVSNDDVFVFGDSGNDINLMKMGWVNIAVNNAIDEIKALSNHITDSCEDNGVANYINENLIK